MEFWRRIPDETDPAIPRFAALLRTLIERVTTRPGQRGISIGKMFANTELHRRHKLLLDMDRDGAPLLPLRDRDFTEILHILKSSNQVGRTELETLISRYQPYRTAMEELDRQRHKNIVRPAYDTRDAWKLIEGRQSRRELNDPEVFREFVATHVEQRGRDRDFVGALRVAAGLQLLLSTKSHEFHRDPTMQRNYRLLVAWKGAWTAYQAGNSELERLFVAELGLLHRDEADPFILRRIKTHVGFHGPLRPSDIQWISGPRQKSRFMFDGGGDADNLRLGAMLTIDRGQDPQEASLLLGGVSPFEALNQAWQRQRDQFNYLEGARTALASYLRVMIQVDEIDKALTISQVAPALIGTDLSGYSSGRLLSAQGQIQLALFRKTGDLTAYREGQRMIGTAQQVLTVLGNKSKVRQMRRQVAKILNEPAGDLDQIGLFDRH